MWWKYLLRVKNNCQPLTIPPTHNAFPLTHVHHAHTHHTHQHTPHTPHTHITHHMHHTLHTPTHITHTHPHTSHHTHHTHTHTHITHTHTRGETEGAWLGACWSSGQRQWSSTRGLWIPHTETPYLQATRVLRPHHCGYVWFPWRGSELPVCTEVQQTPVCFPRTIVWVMCQIGLYIYRAFHMTLNV